MMLGAGMALAGGCPGLIYSQIGAGVPNSVYSFLGGALGAFTYGLIIDPYINANKLFEQVHIRTLFLDKVLNIDYSLLAFLYGCGLMSISYYLEKLFPYANELIKPNPTPFKFSLTNLNGFKTMMKCPSWPPILCGICLGLLQLPTSIILGNTVGGSSSYANVVGQWLRFTDEDTQKYYSHFKAQLNRWWQLVFLISATGGSVLAVHLAGGDVKSIINEPYDNIQGVSTTRAFLGGFVMIFGSRFAKGCASGHGLSGMGLLSVASITAVASMFGAGAVVGYLLKKNQ